MEIISSLSWLEHQGTVHFDTPGEGYGLYLLAWPPARPPTYSLVNANQAVPWPLFIVLHLTLPNVASGAVRSGSCVLKGALVDEGEKQELWQ